jgi:hypothetical protein
MGSLVVKVAALAKRALLALKEAEEESIPQIREMLLEKATKELLQARDEIIEYKTLKEQENERKQD